MTTSDPTEHNEETAGTSSFPLPTPDEYMQQHGLGEPLPGIPSHSPAAADDSEAPAGGETFQAVPVSQTVSRLTIGTVSLVLDVLNNRLTPLESAAEDDPQHHEAADDHSVLIPEEQWGDVLEDFDSRRWRYLAIGALAEARNGMKDSSGRWQRTVQRLRVLNAAYVTPVYQSQLMSPIRLRVQDRRSRTIARMNQMIATGRREEAISRGFAQNTIETTVNDSVSEIVRNQQVQVLVQEVIQTQSLGLVDELIEEIRERTVTGDDVLEKLPRRIFRRTPREQMPPPPFLDTLVNKHESHARVLAGEYHLEGYYAGFASRLIAIALDMVSIWILIALVGWLLSGLMSLFGVDAFLTSMFGEHTTRQVLDIGVSAGMAFLIIFSFFTVSWILTGETPGHALLGLRVVDKQGEYISFGRAILRFIGYFIAAAPLFLGFLWVLGSDQRQGWHDKIARTYVVYAWPARPDENFLVKRDLRENDNRSS